MTAPPSTPRSAWVPAVEKVGLWDADLVAGRFYGDAQAAETYGLDPAIAAAGLRRRTLARFIHPEDAEVMAGALGALLAGAPEFTIHHRVVRADGTLRQVVARGRVVRNAGGRPVRLAGVCVDSTDRLRIEARWNVLLKIVDRLRTQADPRSLVHDAVASLGQHLGAARAGFGMVQPDDATIVIETAYTDGVPPLQGAIPMASFGPEHVAQHQRGVLIVNDGRTGTMANGIGAFVSVPLIRDGKLRATLFVSKLGPHDWAHGDVRLIEGVARRLWDAIERARAEGELRTLNASLEREITIRTRDRDRIWQLAPVLMAVAGPDGRLLAVNPAWTRRLGWSARETVGKPLSDFVAEADREALAADLARLQYAMLPVSHTSTLLTRSGEARALIWTTVPEGGTLYFFGRDITDQRLAEDRLRQAQKMEAVGQLTSGLAHDFNNLLTGIMGSLELLQTRLQQGRVAGLESYIELGQGAARRAAALTQRLLAFSRRQSLDPRPASVDALVGGMQDLIRHAAGPSVEIRVRAPPEPCTVLVDIHQLENALLNLCNNARDAMPDGGLLTIETQAAHLADPAARGLGLPPGAYVVLSVSDTGTGMTPETMRRAFDPFFTTKPVGAGTGLGLSMVYGFAQQSGGAVRIASEPGQGARVSIYLPRAAAPGEDAEPAGLADAVTRAASNETVLVVHPDPAVRAMFAEQLGRLGYAAAEAADGPGGLRMLHAGLAIDLLVAALPGGAGADFAAAAQAARPHLRSLLIGTPGPGSRQAGLLWAASIAEALAGGLAALVTGLEPPLPDSPHRFG